jgi:hypothetical protein
MKIPEVKLRLINTANSLIDTYFGENNFVDKFINSTVKIIVKQNVNKFDDILTLFTDKSGEIDMNLLINEYGNMISDDGIVFDIKSIINNDFIKNMLPNKVLIIK